MPFNAPQQRLPSQRRECVQLELPGEMTAKTDTVVPPIGDELLSLGRLPRQSFRFNLTGKTAWLEQRSSQGPC